MRHSPQSTRFAIFNQARSSVPVIFCSDLKYAHLADLATERERQLKTARANQTAGLANGRTAN